MKISAADRLELKAAFGSNLTDSELIDLNVSHSDFVYYFTRGGEVVIMFGYKITDNVIEPWILTDGTIATYKQLKRVVLPYLLKSTVQFNKIRVYKLINNPAHIALLREFGLIQINNITWETP